MGKQSALLKQTNQRLERDMFSKIKTALFALAAVATVGAASLASSPAEARGFGGFHFGGGGMHFGGGARFGGNHFGGARFGGFRGFHPRLAFNRFNHFHFNHFRRPIWGFNHCRWGFHHCGWHRPIIGGGYVAGPSYVAPSYVAAPPSRPAAATCTCLRKDYTQDGQVVFQDVCTKEGASAPAGNQALGPQQ
jgi:hypothetical protein